MIWRNFFTTRLVDQIRSERPKAPVFDGARVTSPGLNLIYVISSHFATEIPGSTHE